MSIKPTKKSDSEKDWLTKRRSKIQRIAPEYHLIVSEGVQTEPNYFNRIKEVINNKYSDRILLKVEGQGKNTISLFNAAKSIAEHDANGFKHVWIVYDTDSFPADQVNSVVELCKNNSTNDMTYHAIWSNQCIELWYLLHFEYLQSDIDRKAYRAKLTKHLNSINAGCYQKNRDDMYDILSPYMETAIAYAKKLKSNNIGKMPNQAAPGTEVVTLIEKLKRYL